MYSGHCHKLVAFDENTPSTFVRWTDYLTGRSCTLKVSAAHTRLTLAGIVSNYLAVGDPTPLVSDLHMLPDALPDFLALQDLVLTTSDDGVLGNVIAGSIFRCGLEVLRRDQPPPVAVAVLGDSAVDLIDVVIDRSETGYCRNWAGFHLRRWKQNRCNFSRFVEDATMSVDPSDAERVLSLETTAAQIEFLRRVAAAIWDSPFENYSRFTGRMLRYKTADETLMNIIDGRGAICSEKVQALKFLTDRYGFRSRYLFAGPDAVGPFPEARLRHILESFDFEGGQSAMSYWQHMALEFILDDTRILVDATNGNIPFLFMTGPDLEEVLDPDRPRPVRVRMTTYDEDFYYHRAPCDLAHDLFYAMENYIPEIDMVQVFDNELGLVITPEFLVSPVPYHDEEDFNGLVDLYRRLAEPDGLNFEVAGEWRLEGCLGERFREREPFAARGILESHDYLARRYEWFEGPGHDIGLAVVQLREPT